MACFSFNEACENCYWTSLEDDKIMAKNKRHYVAEVCYAKFIFPVYGFVYKTGLPCGQC